MAMEIDEIFIDLPLNSSPIQYVVSVRIWGQDIIISVGKKVIFEKSLFINNFCIKARQVGYHILQEKFI